jgi:hypothetical protein
MHEEMRNVSRILVGKPGMRRPLGRWEYGVGMDLKEIRMCIQKFPDWPPGAITANGTALCH